MEGTKFVKARCKATGKYFALEVKKYGLSWRVVNVDELDADKARVVASEVKQARFETNDNLLACSGCGKRRIGGCGCARKRFNCSADMGYKLDCAYCNKLEIDYSVPTRADLSDYRGEKVTVQGKEIKPITFSNVEWTRFDNINVHTNGRRHGYLHEPKVHVVLKEKNIEFHGYNISEMDEGVYYLIGARDDFDIECDVDTSGIRPHPGGHLYISFGLITANIDQNGGSFFLDGQAIASVGSRFKMRLALTDEGKYSIYINGALVGERVNPSQKRTKVIFGFKHQSHHCSELSHATLSGIKMMQGVAQ